MAIRRNSAAMIEVTEDATGVIIPLRVQPKASSDRIAGEYAGALKVCVTSPPEDGKANAAVIKLIAKQLRVARSSVEIVSGQSSRQKKIHISGVSARDVSRKLAAAGVGSGE